MPATKCNVQQWTEQKTATVQTVYEFAPGRADIQIYFPDRDDSEMHVAFLAPGGMKFAELEGQQKEIDVVFAVRQNLLGDASICVVGLVIDGHEIDEDRII